MRPPPRQAIRGPHRIEDDDRLGGRIAEQTGERVEQRHPGLLKSPGAAGLPKHARGVEQVVAVDDDCHSRYALALDGGADPLLMPTDT